MGSFWKWGSEVIMGAHASGLSSLLPHSVYETKAVIIAMIITAVVSISVTVFCFQTKVRAARPPWHPNLLLYRPGPLGGP